MVAEARLDDAAVRRSVHVHLRLTPRNLVAELRGPWRRLTSGATDAPTGFAASRLSPFVLPRRGYRAECSGECAKYAKREIAICRPRTILREATHAQRAWTSSDPLGACQCSGPLFFGR